MVSEKYNLQVIDYLVSTFRHCTDTMGYSADTVNFYKIQVDALVNISQISSNDVSLVYQALGIDRNVQRINQSTVEKRLQTFCSLMTACMNTNSKEKVRLLLLNAETNKDIVSDIVPLFYDIFAIKKITTPELIIDEKPSFGRFKASKPSEYNENVFDLNRVFGDLIIEIKNLDAVCSGDVSYYYFGISDILFHTEDKLKSDRLIEAISQGKYSIVEQKENTSNPCNHHTYFEKTNLDTSELDAWLKSYALRRRLTSTPKPKTTTPKPTTTLKPKTTTRKPSTSSTSSSSTSRTYNTTPVFSSCSSPSTPPHLRC